MDNFQTHILIVDDDDRIRELVKQYLTENGFLVITAKSAEDASKKIQIIKFDIIILDIMMPGKSGLDFTIENKIPSGGDLSMLMSNIPFFPLDTTMAALSAYKDSLVIKKGWASSDSVYIVSVCDSLNPEKGNFYIFDVIPY